MSRTIWKFPITTHHQQIAMPEGAKILHVAEQYPLQIYLWAEVDTHATSVFRNIFVYGTGHVLPDNPGNYIGSVLLCSEQLIFHFYEGA